MSTQPTTSPPPADTTPTLREALERAAQGLADCSDTPRLDAEVLLAHALGRPRTYLFAHPDRRLDAPAARRFAGLVARRRAGRPVAYLTGGREFWSLPLRVTPDTLIPRPETERLVELALRDIPPRTALRIADLGTGSGAIALALARERPACRVLATDISAAALRVAQENARRLGLDNVEFRRGDWCAALGSETFDLIAANPPYVPAGDPHLQRGDLRFEPPLALIAGGRGLAAIECIVRQARDHLVPGGRLLVEHGYDQAPAVTGLLARHGYTAIESVTDAGGLPRVAAARTGDA